MIAGSGVPSPGPALVLQPAAGGSRTRRDCPYALGAPRVAGACGLLLGLAGALALSLMIGARPIAPTKVVEAFVNFDPADAAHLAVRDLRLPRTCIGLAVGVCLAASGVVMQSLTRNPLADPALLGVNAGAALAVVTALWLFGGATPGGLAWFALSGAGIVAVLVYGFVAGDRRGATPVRLALAGAAVNALLLGLLSAILILNQDTLDAYRFWVTGTLGSASAVPLLNLLPVMLLGAGLALLLGPSLNLIALGDEAAQALGARLGLVRAGALAAVTLMSGAAVAIAGPIAFVGLVVPHLVRAMIGADQRWLLVYAAILGPIVILLADIVGRIILPPGEVQVGIIMALVGGPLFVAIVRRIRLV